MPKAKPKTQERFGQDHEFRKLGWRIESRPEKGEPLWKHEDGRIMTESEVADELERFWATAP